MKCPKCGYNSFEFYDTCKKCSNDLTTYKQTHGLKPLVLPPEARTAMAASIVPDMSADDQHSEHLDTGGDMFAFDIPDDGTGAETVAASDDPFNFGDEQETNTATGFGEFALDDPAPAVQLAKTDDSFSNLIEQTSQSDNPFADATADEPAPQSPAGAPATSASGPGEFDLDNFAWDDTPAASGGADAKSSTDDFDSLFGDSADSVKK